MYIPVIIHKDEDSDYGVTVPDMAGCFSAGKSFADALKNIEEAILFHIEGLFEIGEKPSFEFRDIEELQKEYQDEKGIIFSLVNVDLSKLNPEPTRFNVSWPQYLLTMLDNKLKETHETRSGYLARLVMSQL
jgi:predicted RNase H-like HicB family nuclease